MANLHRGRSILLYHMNLLKPYYEKSKLNSESSVHSLLLATSDVQNFCLGEKQFEKEGYEPDDSII